MDEIKGDFWRENSNIRKLKIIKFSRNLQLAIFGAKIRRFEKEIFLKFSAKINKKQFVLTEIKKLSV